MATSLFSTIEPIFNYVCFKTQSPWASNPSTKISNNIRKRTIMRTFLASVIFACVAVSVVSSTSSGDNDSPSDWAGYWLGTLQNVPLRLLLRMPLHHNHEHPVAIYSLNQGGAKIACNQVDMDEKKQLVKFYFDTINGRYEAKLDETKQFMEGTWFQGQFNAPLELGRFQQDESHKVPREFRFLLQKSVTGPPTELQKMVGFWSGYLDNRFDDTEPEPPELVILEVQKITDDLVEPQVHLPDETPFAIGVRNLVLSESGTVKVVLDDPMSDNNAIFEGQLDGDTLTGNVMYDDTDYAPPLVLKWSADSPRGKPKEAAKVIN